MLTFTLTERWTINPTGWIKVFACNEHPEIRKTETRMPREETETLYLLGSEEHLSLQDALTALHPTQQVHPPTPAPAVSHVIAQPLPAPPKPAPKRVTLKNQILQNLQDNPGLKVTVEHLMDEFLLNDRQKTLNALAALVASGDLQSEPVRTDRAKPALRYWVEVDHAAEPVPR